ncbi:unnamed protein product [Chironomus riparius]|uniref:Uncharacterized protein n=1 Tax=Chironomus riparius TaxID=315576 RepID=A0A9N9RRZ4_9DIPT|nr:unnamed protein product [Chironomus riparius]
MNDVVGTTRRHIYGCIMLEFSMFIRLYKASLCKKVPRASQKCQLCALRKEKKSKTCSQQHQLILFRIVANCNSTVDQATHMVEFL